MRTYRLPQGPRVTLKGDRRLLDQAARYLDAHANAEPEGVGEWTVETVGGVPGALESSRPWEAFGEHFEVATTGAGAVLLRHAGAPTQVWSLDERHVGIAVAPAYGRYAATQAMYAAVRQIGLLAAANGGMAVLHAAAVHSGDGAILICGAKGAGKTTLALALLARGAAYMASDRTIIWHAHDGVQAAGWMGAFRIAPAAIELALDRSAAEAVARYVRRRRAAKAYWFADKFRFPPRDLMALLGGSSRPTSPPRLLIEIDLAVGDGNEPAWMSRAELEAAWRRHTVAGEPVPVGVGESRPVVEAPRELRGVRLGRTASPAMARQVLALAAS